MQEKSELKNDSASAKLTNCAFEDRLETCTDADQSAVDVAKYIMELTSQLQTMAISARFDFLAYFLRLAEFEARSIARGQQGENRRIRISADMSKSSPQ